jgi:hypothetical protein
MLLLLLLSCCAAGVSTRHVLRRQLSQGKDGRVVELLLCCPERCRG